MRIRDRCWLWENCHGTAKFSWPSLIYLDLKWPLKYLIGTLTFSILFAIKQYRNPRTGLNKPYIYSYFSQDQKPPKPNNIKLWGFKPELASLMLFTVWHQCFLVFSKGVRWHRDKQWGLGDEQANTDGKTNTCETRTSDLL